MNTETINIIAVDDETDLQVLFKHFFRKEIKTNKINFSFASSASECLDQLKEVDSNGQSSRICVLTDINMPGTTGVELSKRLNSEYPEIEIYLISAYSEEDLFGLDAISYKEIITKPINFENLKHTLNL